MNYQANIRNDLFVEPIPVYIALFSLVRQDSLFCVYIKTVDIKIIFITVISLKFSKETTTHPSAVLVKSL